VRPQPRGDGDRRGCVVRFPDDDEAVRLERLADAATVRQVVVGDDNSQVLEGGVPPGLASFYFPLPLTGVRRGDSTQIAGASRA
jgi:hypothetical protein